MSQVLRVLGYIIIICGIILGIITGINESSIILAIYWFVSSIISGVLFIAFAIMIELLEGNRAILEDLLYRSEIDEATQQNTPIGTICKPTVRSNKAKKTTSDYKMKSLD